MRTILKLMLAAAVVAATCGTSAADNRGQKEKHQQISPEQQISREELSAKQAMHISGRLGLDEETAALFTETYCNFQKELWETAPRPGRLRPDADEEETAEYLQNRFAQSRKILELREKYYGIYSGFLTQKQILQVFEAEREMMDRLAGRGRGPEGPEGPDHGHRQGPPPGPAPTGRHFM